MPAKTALDGARRLDEPGWNRGQLRDFETVFRALGDSLRIEILRLFVQLGEYEFLTVKAVCANLGKPQPLVSYHLKKLSEAGIVIGSRRGRRSLYHLKPGALEAVRSLLDVPGH